MDIVDIVGKKEVIGISTQGQFTIPQQYFNILGFTNEAECFIHSDGFFIRPIKNVSSGKFTEQILADLISQGYERQELLDNFKKIP